MSDHNSKNIFQIKDNNDHYSILKTIKNSLSVLVPLALMFCLCYIWVASYNDSSSDRPYLKDVVIFLIALFIIFLADSLEIAYSLLRNKDSNHIKGMSGVMLKWMQKEEDYVYGAREWMITAIIAFLSIMFESYHWTIGHIIKYSDPVFGDLQGLKGFHYGTLFAIACTSIPVLWFAQGPAKKLARHFPLMILSLGSLVWTIIFILGKIIDFVGLEAPSKVLARACKDIYWFKKPIKMEPNDFSYFVSSVQRYGFCAYQVSKEITIGESGSCIVKHHEVYYIQESHVSNITRHALFYNSNTTNDHLNGNVTVRVFKLNHIMQDFMRKEDSKIFDDLNNIVQGRTSHLEEVPNNLSIMIDEQIRPNIDNHKSSTDPAKHNYVAYSLDIGGVIDDTENHTYAIEVIYQTNWGPNAFWINADNDKEDFFFLDIEWPYYKYCLKIILDQAVVNKKINLTNFVAKCGQDLHWGEQDRLRTWNHSSSDRCLDFEFVYPFTGVKYTVYWKYV